MAIRFSEATAQKCLEHFSAEGIVAPDGASVPASHADQLDSLLSSGHLDEEHLFITLSRIFAMRRDIIAASDIETALIDTLPSGLISRYQILPVRISGAVCECAVFDPAARQHLADIRTVTGRQCDCFLISPSNFAELLSSPQLSACLSEDASYLPPLTAENSTRASSDRDVPQIIDQILASALLAGASDIHIERFRHQARLRFRLDGKLVVRREAEQALNTHYDGIITRLKILSKCDIAERRLPQDGAFSLYLNSEEIDFRISFVPAKYANRAVLRLLRHQTALSLDRLGFSDDEFSQVRRAISLPQGMVLVTGPTGSGKTTTLYACLQHINQPACNIMTAEDPVEYYLEGISQIEINEKIGLGFDTVLRSFLRQDPETILLGEIRDSQTADMAVKAALTGHLLLSTLHTNDALSTITRLSDMGVPLYLISSALRLIIAQRLVRVNCQYCLTPDPIVQADELCAAGIHKDEVNRLQLMVGTGCAECHQTGFSGRQAIYEIIEMTDQLQTALHEHKAQNEILAIARDSGFISMAQRATALLSSGVLSASEFLRVLAK